MPCRHNACDKPQEASDAEIDAALETGDVARHMSTCQRPPLPQCTATEFEEDLLTFLEGRGEEELANHLRNKRINWYGANREHPLAQQGLGRSLGPSRVRSVTLDLAWLCCIAWLAALEKFVS